MNPLARYHYMKAHTPPAGQGNDFNSYHLMRAAATAVKAGIPLSQFSADMLAIPHKRRVTYGEIARAYGTVQGSAADYSPRERPKPIVKDGKKAFRGIANQGTMSDEADLWESSKIRIDWPLEEDTVWFLGIVFRDDELAFIGDRSEIGVIGQNIRFVSEWRAFFLAGGVAGPFVIVNPLSGKAMPRKDGLGMTYRGDACVSAYRHALVEFDGITHREQIRFWSAAKLPVIALVDSANESIHAWLRVDVKTAEDWQTEINGRLYDELLIPMGVDRACSNPARLSRLPGFVREETAQYQRLLWASTDGRRIAS
jgi:hypothetical protein